MFFLEKYNFDTMVLFTRWVTSPSNATIHTIDYEFIFFLICFLRARGVQTVKLKYNRSLNVVFVSTLLYNAVAHLRLFNFETLLICH